MRSVFLALLFITSFLQTYGQYNDSVNHYVGVASTGTINKSSGNTSYVLSNGLKFGVRKKEVALNLASGWLFGEQNRKRTNNDYNSSLDFNLYKTLPHFYYWGLGNYTSSYSLKINSQYQGGVGVAYNFIDKKTAQLNFSDGIIYEYSDIYLKDTIRDVYNTFRNSFRLQFKWLIKDIVVLNGSSFFQNSLSSQNDYIVRANVSLGVKLRKWLTLGTTFSYNRFNRTAKENTLFNYGLTIDKYF